MTVSWPTVPLDPPHRWNRVERVIRSITLFVVIIIVLLGVTGRTGVATETTWQSNEHVRVEIRHATASRPGLPTPFTVAVEAIAGEPFPARLDISVPSDYLAMFDENGLTPAPDSESSDGRYVTWTYRPEPGVDRHLAINFDARLQPNTHRGRSGTVSVTGELPDGSTLGTVLVPIGMTVFP